jgi:hypothetical protein
MFVSDVSYKICTHTVFMIVLVMKYQVPRSSGLLPIAIKSKSEYKIRSSHNESVYSTQGGGTE